MPTEKKIQTVQNLIEKLKANPSLVLLNFAGSKSADLNLLRAQLAPLGASLTVTKNALLRIALKQTKYPSVDSQDQIFTQPTAALFLSQEDPGALRLLTAFIQERNLLQIKGGFWEGQFLESSAFKKLSLIPSRSVLLGQLSQSLNLPVRNFAVVLTERLQTLMLLLEDLKRRKEFSQL